MFQNPTKPHDQVSTIGLMISVPHSLENLAAFGGETDKRTRSETRCPLKVCNARQHLVNDIPTLETTKHVCPRITAGCYASCIRRVHLGVWDNDDGFDLWCLAKFVITSNTQRWLLEQPKVNATGELRQDLTQWNLLSSTIFRGQIFQKGTNKATVECFMESAVLRSEDPCLTQLQRTCNQDEGQRTLHATRETQPN